MARVMRVVLITKFCHFFFLFDGKVRMFDTIRFPTSYKDDFMILGGVKILWS